MEKIFKAALTAKLGVAELATAIVEIIGELNSDNTEIAMESVMGIYEAPKLAQRSLVNNRKASFIEFKKYERNNSRVNYTYLAPKTVHVRYLSSKFKDIKAVEDAYYANPEEWENASFKDNYRSTDIEVAGLIKTTASCSVKDWQAGEDWLEGEGS